MNATLMQLAVTLAQAAPAGSAPAAQSGDHTMMLIWGIVLISLGIAMFMVEILVPSGGIIGLAAAAAVVVGVIFLFRVDTGLGLIGAIVAIAALPFVIGAAIKIWPDTPIARLLILKTPPRGAKKSGAEGAASAGSDTPAIKLGDTGRAITPLRPVGTVIFSGKREECLAVGGVIEKDAAVRVVNIDGRHIKVKVVSD